MTTLTGFFYRVVVLVTAIAFLASCTKSIPVPKSEAIEQKDFRHKMRLQMTNGDVLETKHMTVEDSTVTIYSLVMEGRSVDQTPPLRVPLNDVASMERVQFDDVKTIGAILFISVPVVVLTWLIVDRAGELN